MAFGAAARHRWSGYVAISWVLVLAGLFNVGGGLGLLGVSAVLMARGIEIALIPVIALVSGAILLPIGVLKVVTGFHLRRKREWALTAAFILISVTIITDLSQLATSEGLNLRPLLSLIFNGALWIWSLTRMLNPPDS